MGVVNPDCSWLCERCGIWQINMLLHCCPKAKRGR